MKSKDRKDYEGRDKAYGADKVRDLGTLDMGISKFSKEPYSCELTPLKNKFSPIFDTSMDEAMKMAGGNASMRDKAEREDY